MAEQEKVITIPYTPRPQLAHLHPLLEASEESVLVLHRRAGKTYLLINHIIKKALQFPGDDGEYAYIAPFLKQAKRVAWKYLKRFCDPLPDRRISESELSITLPNGSRIGLYGADNPEALRGIYLDGAVLDEFSDIDPDVYESILSPALMDRNGWVVFSGTANGKNHLFNKMVELRQDPQAFVKILNVVESKILTPEQLVKARKRAGSQEKYDREYMCSFDSVAGKKIYPEFRYDTHVATQSLIPEGPTHIIRGHDNTGLNPAISLTYMTNTGQWRIFKEFVFRDVGIMDAVEAMILWCNMNLHPGCRYTDYADPAGKNRDSTKMSPRDYIIIKSREMGQDITLIDGIQTPEVRWAAVGGRLTRVFNGEPALLIDPSCDKLIEGFMGAYAYKPMANLPGIFMKKADKTAKCADIHDSIQYIATRLFVTHDAAVDIKRRGHSDYLDEDEDFGYSVNDQRTGRSSLAGY